MKIKKFVEDVQLPKKKISNRWRTGLFYAKIL